MSINTAYAKTPVPAGRTDRLGLGSEGRAPIAPSHAPRVPGSEFEVGKIAGSPSLEMPHNNISVAHDTIAARPAFATPLVERIGKVFVVRDDLIPGGTKARILPQWLPAGDEFVYASPAYGYAQVALATTCRDLGRRATVFTAKRNTLHPRTLEAQRAGAKIVLVPTGYLTNVQAKALAYCEASGACLLPFGMHDAQFLALLASVARSIPISPAEVWCAAGSGTLATALAMAWPRAVVHAVQVGAKPSLPSGSHHYQAAEKFDQPARKKPPFPSCANYDAKVWQFIERYATPGALFWNVAA